ncbi:MAG: hypothetical protein ABWY55_04225 [Microbacterium sp.]
MTARGWLTAGGLALLLVAAGAVGTLTPTDQWQDPFLVAAPMGDRAIGRDIQGTVHGITLADEVHDGSWSSGEGSLWVIVDTGLETRTRDGMLGLSTLQVGDRLYSASDRPPSSTLRRGSLTVGIPTRGVLAFELPGTILDDAGADTAELRLAVSDDPRLDSVLVTPVSLAELPHEESLELEPPVWGHG